jgi:hypothetical protein
MNRVSMSVGYSDAMVYRKPVAYGEEQHACRKNDGQVKTVLDEMIEHFAWISFDCNLAIMLAIYHAFKS